MTTKANPPAPLRQGQRDDGRGVFGHARIHKAGPNAGTSALLAPARIPDANSYK